MVFILELSFRYFIEFTSLNLFRFGGIQQNLFFDLLTVYSVQFIFFVLFNITLASISAHGSFSTSLKDNFKVLFKYPIRIIASWTIYFLIFSLPSIIIVLASFILVTSVFPNLLGFFGIFFSLLLLSSVILGYPLMSLIATRIYSTTLSEDEI